MNVRLKKWGKSTAVVLPASILKAAGLRDNQVVQIGVANGTIVIAHPPHPLSYRLSDLVAGMTNENRHAAIDTRPMGIERL